jgi:ADP-heptose:LPS heptosyltransferase
MNLIITVDTVIAHLADALNIPAWVTLAHSPDWRWMREDSPCIRRSVCFGRKAVATGIRY